MSPHMTGNDGLFYAILLGAPFLFGLCGALSIVALLLRGRAARIAQMLATAGLILVHAIVLASVPEFWLRIMLARGPFFFLAPLGHALVLAGYLRVRSIKHTRVA